MYKCVNATEKNSVACSLAYDEDKENEEENEDNLKDESW